MDKDKPLQRILEHIPMPVVIASPATATILWVNHRLARWYGVEDPRMLEGLSLLDFIQAPQIAKALSDLAKVVAGASPPPVTYQLKKANGEFAAGQVSSVPIVFRGLPAMLSFVTDVSESERLVASLQESEKRYRLLLDELSAGVVVIADDRIAWANGSMARALGFDEAIELRGESLYRFIDESCHKDVQQGRRTVLVSGKPREAFPVVLLRRDGSTFTATASTTRIRWEGELATQTLVHDVKPPPARGSKSTA